MEGDPGLPVVLDQIEGDLGGVEAIVGLTQPVVSVYPSKERGWAVANHDGRMVGAVENGLPVSYSAGVENLEKHLEVPGILPADVKVVFLGSFHPFADVGLVALAEGSDLGMEGSPVRPLDTDDLTFLIESDQGRLNLTDAIRTGEDPRPTGRADAKAG